MHFIRNKAELDTIYGILTVVVYTPLVMGGMISPVLTAKLGFVDHARDASLD